ncbi:MFS transporter [Vagococcus sp. BWB3-3]|uniref:MFS transporter n=1 Tax=Vagococcus allomyrinae TaxID=2794353 RepID=A0A940P9C8_9ENTE|nr:MFS transporter [Vagococcus allomyrinae]MBP1040854.1 MFS transporter [Vagococcus allomyrinae]
MTIKAANLSKIGLLSVSLLVVSGGAIAANIPAISQSYSDVSQTLIELLTTMPSLFIMLTLLVGHKVATKIGYSRTILMGIFLVLIAGLLPVFTRSFMTLCFSRVLFGIGIGLFNPLLYVVSTTLYKGAELAKVIGLQSAFEGIGGMVMTFLVGQLLIINWRVSFLAYGLALPIFLLFALLVPKIPAVEADKAVITKKADISVWGYAVLLVVAVTVYMSLTVKLTSLLLTKGIGNATDGSNLMALVGLGAMLAGLVFGPVVTSLKRWTLPCSFLGLSFAMCLIAVAQHLVVAAFAVMLCGLSFRTFVPYIFNEVNQPVNNGQKNTTVLLIAFNLGAAFAPVTIAFFNRMVVNASLSGLFLSEALLMLLLAVGSGLWLLFKSRIERLRAS